MDRKKALPTYIAASMLLIRLTAAAAMPSFATDLSYQAGSGAVLLKGPWVRYQGELSGDSATKAAGTAVEFSLRSKLPKPEALNTGSVSAGERSYRIDIRVEGLAPLPRLAISIPAFAGASEVYVNDQRLYDSKRDPASTALFLFDAQGGQASITVRLPAGVRGLEEASVYPPFVLFGDAASVSRSRVVGGAAVTALDGFFLITGLFSLVLFFFWKRNREFLALAIYAFFIGLAFAGADGALFLRVFPSASLQQLELGCLIALDLQFAAFFFFAHSLYRKRIAPAITALAYALPLFLAAASLALPSLTYQFALASAAYGAVFGLASLAALIYMAAKADLNARWLIPAFLAIPFALATSIFGPETFWNAYLVGRAGLVVFVGISLLMLIRQVARGFEAAEELTVYVESVSHAVKSFIPQEFLEHLQKENLVDLRLGDHAKKEMTIFFSDIRSFTQLSESLTVEQNFAFINSYLARVVPIIKENGGFVDKYVGDGIMALFPGPKGPDEAIRAAIAMQSKVVEYNGHRANMGYRPIAMGVGIHTGDLMLGVVGVEDRMENTVISDAVNLSSRLQSITKAFNISLAISEQSFKELEDPGEYKYRFIGKVKVKGKDAPVSVFEIFDGIAPELFERKMKANMFFEQGMLSYYQKDFAGAMYYFKRVLEIIPEDGAAGFYLDNCMNKAVK